MPGVDRIWLPGEQSAMKRAESLRDGIPVADGVVAQLAELAERLGIAPLDAS